MRACIENVSTLRFERESERGLAYTVVVNDLDDGGELAGRGTVVNENDAADLDVALESGIRGHDCLAVVYSMNRVSQAVQSYSSGLLLLMGMDESWFGEWRGEESEGEYCISSRG